MVAAQFLKAKDSSEEKKKGVTMLRARALSLGLACLLLLAPLADAQKAQKKEKAPASSAAAASSSASRIQFTDVRLENGLRVILSEDHSAPTYSIAVTYNVGSRDERPGRTGFAHLFEHMMFQGSENVGKGEHFIIIQVNGGSMNGTTNADRTNYFQTLPANQLDLGLWLEADRMRSLVINQANLDNQRHAVQEERRLRVDNQPYGRTFETVLETAYDNFAYKHSTIGSMDDLNAATLEDVAEFFRIYYAPNNAVLTLVGNFKTEDALARVKKYFGDIPRQPAPPEPDMTEPAQKAERRAEVPDAFAPVPRLDIVYKIPPANTPDWYALNVLGQVLSSGQSSRLYQKLVRELQIAQNVNAGAQERRGPSLKSIGVTLRPGRTFEEVEKAVYEELERLQAELVEPWELEKVHMQMRRQRAQQLRSTLSRAIVLGTYTVYYDDPGLINTFEDNIRAVTREDIRRVAREYLKPANRTVVTTVPTRQAPAGAGR
jgi:zinc protease